MSNWAFPFTHPYILHCRQSYYDNAWTFTWFLGSFALSASLMHMLLSGQNWHALLEMVQKDIWWDTVSDIGIPYTVFYVFTTGWGIFFEFISPALITQSNPDTHWRNTANCIQSSWNCGITCAALSYSISSWCVPRVWIPNHCRTFMSLLLLCIVVNLWMVVVQ